MRTILGNIFTSDVDSNKLSNNRYGIWVMSGNYSVPVNTQVGIANHRFPFNTLKSGSFPDYNTTTHKLTVTKKGLYSLGWDGNLAVGDNFGGNHRAAVIRITTSSLSGVANFIGNNQAASTSGVFAGIFGVSGITFLDIGDVVEFGFEYQGSAGLGFSNVTTTLRIALLHTL